MADPKTSSYWISRGYTFDCEGHCEACSAPVQYWMTPSKGRRTSLRVPLSQVTFESHWASCPQAKSFRTEERLKVGAL